MLARHLETGEALGLVVRLHLRDEFRVTALRFNDGNDAGLIAAGVAANQTMGQVFALRSLAIFWTLDSVFLHQHPLIATIFKSFDELVSDIRMIGQSHLGGRKPAHPRQGIHAKNSGEMMLPRADMLPEILRRSRRRHRMSPRAA